MRFGELFGVRKCVTSFGFQELVGYVRAKWGSFHQNTMSLTYTVVGHGEGVLCDDDDVFYMMSLAREMSLDRVEVSVKQREGVVPDVVSCVRIWSRMLVKFFVETGFEFRKALCMYSVETGFEFTYVKNERWKLDLSLHTLRMSVYVSQLNADTVKKLNYGVDISYYVAWRSVTAGKQHVFGDDTSSYSHLPSYFEELGRTNPDSVYNLDIDADTMKFRQLYPVAFGIVSEESDSNWAYFLTHLRVCIGTDRVVTFFSDRNHGILDGVKNIFPDCLHIYCLYHMQLNLSSKCRGCPSGFRKKMAHLFNACAYAPTKSEFDVHIKEFIETGGTRIRNFLADLPYNNWTCAHFEGNRYGQMASSVAESWNMKIGVIRGLPITDVVDGLRSIMMVEMFVRAEEAAVMSTVLCTPIQGAVNKLVHDSRVLITKRASEYIYEVLSTPTAVVDIRNRSCTCRAWQVNGLSCIHVACVLFHNNNDGYAYVDYYYTVRPPDYHIRCGRPKVKRIPSRGEKVKRKIKCSSCNRMGNHNKKTCRRPL
ncbi:PREDICTED: uncharacterized protein LOC105956952 [Erythranthe guttata]|uniref:uncharacterized protein LOC105956952 n=1 Tax=Erythranthe guttata TaxID=4155 RepID=UPI00064D85AC|nr:PREDICTED: uncharacterized protein LOC105956952 [Erythranthe guttata]|eukprot:XP_012836319.1 PREDICTED: uncharacterized protein LOC105956952 [Erythranthe guttata]